MATIASTRSVVAVYPLTKTKIVRLVTCDPIWVTIFALSIFLLFYQLGGRPFWQDEAETANLARNVIKFKFPLAFDGVNLISQEEQREFGTNFVWNWSPWLQIYIAAIAFLVGGETTAAGRFPFALMGFFCVCLVYRLIRVYFQDLAWARLSAAILAFHVPFLLFARQLRYFSLGMLLALVAAEACFVRPQTARTRVVSAVTLALMFHSNYLSFISFFPSLLISKLLLTRRLPYCRNFILPSLAMLFIILPGAILYSIGKQGEMLDFTTIPSNFRNYFLCLFHFMIPMPVMLWLCLRWRAFFVGLPVFTKEASERFVLYLVCTIFLNILFVVLIPQCFHRYLAHLYPFCSIILGWAVLKVWKFHRPSGVLLAMLLLFTNWLHVIPLQILGIASIPPQTDYNMLNYPNVPLKLFLTETIKGYPDINLNLINFFNKYAKPSDTVLITYGDMPLQFYTRCKVIGGLQDRVPDEGELPDWVVKRNISRTNRDDVLVSSDDYIFTKLNFSCYEAIELPYADEMFGAREDPYYRRFIPMEEPTQKLIIYKLKQEWQN